MNWIYEKSADNSARFVLGTVGENPLVCFGINPSTAEPNRLDRTVGIVKGVAESNGFDSFIMLNVYAQRATNPDDLPITFVPELKQENERQIANVLAGRQLPIWVAWGELIEKRNYLSALFRDILAMPELSHCDWLSRGRPTKSGHPHHPLYVARAAPLEPFDVNRYR